MSTYVTTRQRALNEQYLAMWAHFRHHLFRHASAKVKEAIIDPEHFTYRNYPDAVIDGDIFVEYSERQRRAHKSWYRAFKRECRARSHPINILRINGKPATSGITTKGRIEIAWRPDLRSLQGLATSEELRSLELIAYEGRSGTMMESYGSTARHMRMEDLESVAHAGALSARYMDRML